MKRVRLERYAYMPDCTLGVLSVDALSLFTIERPWLNNEPYISCIPEGFYCLAPYTSAKFRNVYEIEPVSGRSYILLHSGNRVEDVAGCVAVGVGRQIFGQRHRVTQSRLAMEQLRRALGNDYAYIDVSSRRAVL